MLQLFPQSVVSDEFFDVSVNLTSPKELWEVSWELCGEPFYCVQPLTPQLSANTQRTWIFFWRIHVRYSLASCYATSAMSGTFSLTMQFIKYFQLNERRVREESIMRWGNGTLDGTQKFSDSNNHFVCNIFLVGRRFFARGISSFAVTLFCEELLLVDFNKKMKGRKTKTRQQIMWNYKSANSPGPPS